MSTDWMGSIDGSKLLSQLSIPGTHDSCTYNVSLLQQAMGYIQCQYQEYNLEAQLNNGIRCLDIRARHFKDGLPIHHGSAYLDMNFNDVMDICESFLKEHSGETIVMFVKNEHDEEDCKNKYHETFLRHVNGKKALFYLGEEVPALSVVRGKIVLLRRFSSPQALGIDLTGWADDTAFSINRPMVTFHIQDKYNVDILKSEKWEQVKNLFDQARSSAPSASDWYINFVSGVGAPLATPALVCADIVPRVRNYLSSQDNHGHVGTVLMDFPPDDVIANIIARNK